MQEQDDKKQCGQAAAYTDTMMPQLVSATVDSGEWHEEPTEGSQKQPPPGQSLRGLHVYTNQSTGEYLWLPTAEATACSTLQIPTGAT